MRRTPPSEAIDAHRFLWSTSFLDEKLPVSEQYRLPSKEQGSVQQHLYASSTEIWHFNVKVNIDAGTQDSRATGTASLRGMDKGDIPSHSRATTNITRGMASHNRVTGKDNRGMASHNRVMGKDNRVMGKDNRGMDRLKAMEPRRATSNPTTNMSLSR